MEGYEIRKGGKLIRTYWQVRGRVRGYRTRDVTSYAPRLLFVKTTLARGVTLRDIFLLLNKHLDQFEFTLGNWCREIVTEGLSGAPKRGGFEHEEFRSLELYWQFEQENLGKNDWYFYGTQFPDFHALGPKYRKERREEDCVWPKGSRKEFGVSFSSSRDLIDLPIKLRREVEIWGLAEERSVVRANGGEYTLGQILYGIIWELSYAGNPEKRERMAKKLFGAAEKAMKNAKGGRNGK